MNLSRFPGACLILFLCASLLGQEAGSLDGSLESYLRQAQSGHPGLQAAFLQYEAAKQKIPQAAALPDPMFQVTHFVESVQTRTGPQENIFMVSQKFPWAGTRSGKESAAASEARAVWYAYQSRQLQVVREVALGYYELAHAGEAVRLTRESIRLLKDLEPVVEQKVTVGAPLNALLRLKVETGKVEDRLQTLVQGQHVQEVKLRELLGIQEGKPLPLPAWEDPGVYSPDAEALAKGLQENNPELLMLRQDIQSAGIRRELARLAGYPDITLGVNYVELGRMEGTTAMAIPQKDPWAVTLSINIPIWKEKVLAAQNETRSMEEVAGKKYDGRRLSLGTEMAVALAFLEDANRRAKLYGDELLGLAKQAVENTRASYENGKSAVLDLIDSERSLLDIQILHRRAATDAWKQRVILQSLANLPPISKSPSQPAEKP
jgi:cobalt-zinc-cadmium efflux system outer membrane protein